jgi:hypothetical protein
MSKILGQEWQRVVDTVLHDQTSDATINTENSFYAGVGIALRALHESTDKNKMFAQLVDEYHAWAMEQERLWLESRKQ